MIIKKMSGLAEISRLNIDDINIELSKLVTEGSTQALDRMLARTVHG